VFDRVTVQDSSERLGGAFVVEAGKAGLAGA
jgi:hypothetical protein